MTVVDVHADPRLKTERRFFLGRTAQGDRVWMLVRITESTGTTIEHEEDVTTLAYSFTFELIELGQHSVTMCGAGTGWSIRAVTLPTSASRVHLKRLAELAERWHLNTMRAGCAHMPVHTGNYEEHKFDECSAETGYRFGRGWLIEEVPTEDVIEIEHLLAKIGVV